MENDTWKPLPSEKPAISIKALVEAAHATLAQPALVWRSLRPDDIVPVRMLYISPMSTTFISPEPIEPGEPIQIALHSDDDRLAFHVVNCENLRDEAYRVSAFRVSP